MKSSHIHSQLHVTIQGVGQPLVLVHGFPLDHTMWNGVMPLLSKYWQVISPDLRGFGKSPWPKNDPPLTSSDITENRVTLSIETLADDLHAILERSGITSPVTLCGLSMGGYIAFEFWKRYRDRLNGLVLCDTRASVDSPQAIDGRYATAKRVLDEGPAFLTESMTPRLFCPTSIENQITAVEETKQTIVRTDPRAIAAAPIAMAKRSDATPQLQNINAPTLVLCGEHDVISPAAEMQEWAKRIPRSTFATIPNAGHMSPVEQPEAFAEVLNKWKRDNHL